MIRLAFDKLKDAYPTDFTDNIRPSDVSALTLTCFAVEKLSQEGEL